MKKLSLTLLSCFFLLYCSANGDDKQKTSSAENSSKIKNKLFRNLISFPDHLNTFNHKEIVLLAFEEEASGNVKILQSNYSNHDFLAYVTDKLSTAKLSYEEFGATTQYVKLTFVSR